MQRSGVRSPSTPPLPLPRRGDGEPSPRALSVARRASGRIPCLNGCLIRRHYTPELANRSLPLVARIAADIQQVARSIHSDWQRLQAGEGDAAALQARLEEMRDRFGVLSGELEQLGVELKDALTGLLDFRAIRSGREVYLCWRLGEPAVAHWHDLDAGFAGRRPIADF